MFYQLLRNSRRRNPSIDAFRAFCHSSWSPWSPEDDFPPGIVPEGFADEIKNFLPRKLNQEIREKKKKKRRFARQFSITNLQNARMNDRSIIDIECQVTMTNAQVHLANLKDQTARYSQRRRWFWRGGIDSPIHAGAAENSTNIFWLPRRLTCFPDTLQKYSYNFVAFSLCIKFPLRPPILRRQLLRSFLLFLVTSSFSPTPNKHTETRRGWHVTDNPFHFIPRTFFSLTSPRSSLRIRITLVSPAPSASLFRGNSNS